MKKISAVEVSSDNKNFTEVLNGNNFLPIEDLKVQTKEIEANFSPVEARFVRVKAIQYDKLPHGMKPPKMIHIFLLMR